MQRISGAGFRLLSGMGTGSFGRLRNFLVMMGFTSIESVARMEWVNLSNSNLKSARICSVRISAPEPPNQKCFIGDVWSTHGPSQTPYQTFERSVLRRLRPADLRAHPSLRHSPALQPPTAATAGISLAPWKLEIFLSLPQIKRPQSSRLLGSEGTFGSSLIPAVPTESG